MRAYTQLLIKTCHRRGVHAMGGMAAQIPIKDDPAANEAALAKVRADKLREVNDGHDGTWVAHPGLVPVAREIFDAHMKGENQLERKREDVHVTAADLLARPHRHAHRGRAPAQRPRRRAVPGGVAARLRLRAALQPDGGRGHRRDLARPGLAVDPPRRRARRRARRHAELFRATLAEEMSAVRAQPRRRALRRRPLRRRHRALRAALHRGVVRRVPHRCPPTSSSPRSPHPWTTVAPPPRPPDVSTPEKRSTPMSAANAPFDPLADSAPVSKTELPGRWDGIVRPYGAEDVRRLRGSYRIEHTLADMGARSLWQLLQTEPYVTLARRHHRQPGDAAGARRAQGHLPLRLAGRGGQQRGVVDVPRPEPLPRQQRARPWSAASTTRSSAPTRSSTPRARPRRELAGADHRRRRGRLRRAAQRLRADEGA